MRTFGVIAGIIFLLVINSGCASQTEETVTAPPVLDPTGFVDMLLSEPTGIAARGTMQQIRTLSGIVRVGWEPLSFDASGVVAMVYVLPGDTVYHGQLLARLDGGALAERIERQQAVVDRMVRSRMLTDEQFTLSMLLRQLDYTDAMRQASINLDAAAMDAAHEILLDIERQEIIHAYDMELRMLNISTAQDYLQELLDSQIALELFAHADGVVSFTQAWEGLFVTYETIIFYLSEPQDVFVEYLGHAPYDTWLTRSSRIEGHIDGRVYELIYTPMATSRELAIMRMLGETIDWRFEIVPLHGHVPDLGAYVSILFYTVYVPDALMVPVNALRSFAEGGFYVRRKEYGEFVTAPVRVGDRTDSFVQILDGLEEGDEVLVQ